MPSEPSPLSPSPSPPNQRRPGRLRPKLRSLLQVLSALVLALLLAEGALRVFGTAIPPRMPPEKTGVLQNVSEEKYPGLGLVLRAGARGETVYPGVRPVEARTVVYQVNELGFRSRPVEHKKPKGVFRIALLGDSVTYGTGIDEADTLAALLEPLLTEATGRTVEVVNCGVPATNTGQQVALLKYRVNSIQPDLVLICSTIVDASGYGVVGGPGNQTPELTGWLERLGLTSGVFESDALTPAQSRLMTWRRRSRLVDLLSHKLYRVLYGAASAANYKATWAEGAPGVVAIRAALAKAAAFGEQCGFELRVLMYPSLVNLGDDYPFSEETRRLGAICAELGLPFTDLLPALAGQDAGALRAHVHDRHPNRRANERVARWLVDVLAPLVPAPPTADDG